MQTAAEFWSNVDMSAGPNACWPWTAGTYRHRYGYGQVRWGGTSRRAHRVAYELAVGPIPDGMTIDHVKERGCTTTRCCNPAHLEPVTRAENLRRQSIANARDTCGRGHPKTPEHGRIRTYSPTRHAWRCTTCERMTIEQRKVAA